VNKPDCGTFGQTTGDTILALILAILGAIGTIVGLVKGVADLLALQTLTTILGVSAAGAIWVAGAAGAVVGLVIIGASVWDRLSSRDGINRCYAGVVTSVTESFNDFASNIAPYTAQHDRVDVVVKPTYWDLVSRGLTIFCDSDSLSSPLIRSYYHSSEIVGAAVGSIVGGVAGTVGGILLAAGAVAAIGCASVILCLFALLLAFLIALAAVLVGALIGGQVGRAAAGDSDPTGSPAGGGQAATVRVGDYVSINGNMVLYPEDGNAIVAWWVIDTTVHGRSDSGEGAGGLSPFPFTDPRDHLDPDACPVVTDTQPVG
jgi:hypothetical protein